MKSALPLLLLVLAAGPAAAHPHEWVDWGAGLVLNEKKPVQAVSVQLDLTWDEWYSALVLADFPHLADGRLSAADLAQLDAVYGLGSPNRSFKLDVVYRGQPVAVKPVIQAPRSNGKTITLVYRFALGLTVSSPSELRIGLWDPTYYTDMGIKAKNGATFVGVKDQAAYAGAATYEQDFGHPYFGGTVFPEYIVFALRP